MLGVSVVICTHNGAKRLPVTLAHLSKQQVNKDVKWEVILVDNASTDNTREAAESYLARNCETTFRVIQEPRLGLGNARSRGFHEAQYEIISLVDDDNWVSPEWVQTVSEIMTEHPSVGLCGGINEPVFEIDPPEWFSEYMECYAVGRQGGESGDVTRDRDYLWGAGMSMRKSAWEQLLRTGFRPLLMDRQGKRLTSSGDVEICRALRLMGWRMWYDSRLRLEHFIPAVRLKWHYVRKISRGCGAASVGLEPYLLTTQPGPGSRRERLIWTWQWQAAGAAKVSFLSYGRYLVKFFLPWEGSRGIIELEYYIGRFFELLSKRKSYNNSLRDVNAVFSRENHKSLTTA